MPYPATCLTGCTCHIDFSKTVYFLTLTICSYCFSIMAGFFHISGSLVYHGNSCTISTKFFSNTFANTGSATSYDGDLVLKIKFHHRILVQLILNLPLHPLFQAENSLGESRHCRKSWLTGISVLPFSKACASIMKPCNVFSFIIRI